MMDAPCPALLVLNAGSSTLKFSLYFVAAPTVHCLGSGMIEVRQGRATLAYQAPGSEAEHQEQWRADSCMDAVSLGNLMRWLGSNRQWQIDGAAHRVVHGGARREVAARVDSALIDEIQRLIPMAPLHQPLCLAPILHMAREHPELPQVACFDTAFHHTLDPLETLYGLPRALSEAGLRRYGFHGLSYEYIAGVLADYDPRAAAGRTLVAHLGNGASLCAMRNRISCGTTMGFSTLDGLLMGTRPGNLDPGHRAVPAARTRHEHGGGRTLLYHESDCWASLAVWRVTCGRCWPATPKGPRRPLSCLYGVPSRKSARWPHCSAGSTRWCSPAALANMHPPCVTGFSTVAPG
ncbi:hypothetical protein BZ164_28870 [Pseudomonas veronii]|nr:hypothetical protein BZ164_28870 [Pseudomonas veronii]